MGGDPAAKAGAVGAALAAARMSHSAAEAGGDKPRPYDTEERGIRTGAKRETRRVSLYDFAFAYVPSNSTFQVFPPSADDSQSWRTLASACGVHVMR